MRGAEKRGVGVGGMGGIEPVLEGVGIAGLAAAFEAGRQRRAHVRGSGREAGEHGR